MCRLFALVLLLAVLGCAPVRDSSRDTPPPARDEVEQAAVEFRSTLFRELSQRAVKAAETDPGDWTAAAEAWRGEQIEARRVANERLEAAILRAGLRRFVGPFVCGCGARDGDSPPSSLLRPLNTIVTKDAKCLAVPYMVEVNHAGEDSRTSKLDTPVGTMSTKNGRGLVLPMLIGQASGSVARPVDQPSPTICTAGAVSLTVPFLVPNFGERYGQPPRTHSVADACPAITGHGAGQLVVPFISHFYGNGHSSSLKSPVDTITTRDRHALVTASLLQTMADLRVVDIGFRMLQNHELAAAQGFPKEYVFCGSKAAITRQIGNSVSPPVAAAITRAIAGAA